MVPLEVRSFDFWQFSSGSYFYRPLSCELCKAVYPTYVTMGSERMPLVEASDHSTLNMA